MLNENLSLNTRDLVRALLGVISRGRHRSLSEFRALRAQTHAGFMEQCR